MYDVSVLKTISAGLLVGVQYFNACIALYSDGIGGVRSRFIVVRLSLEVRRIVFLHVLDHVVIDVIRLDVICEGVGAGEEELGFRSHAPSASNPNYLVRTIGVELYLALLVLTMFLYMDLFVVE